MKKIFIAVFAAVICFCTSCDNNNATVVGKGDTPREKNLAASAIIANAFKTGDVSKIDSAVAEDFIDHTDQGDKKGRDSLKAMVAMVRENFPDMKVETVHEVADDDYVFSWMRYSGTSDGTLGLPKGPYEMRAIEVSKFKDGKAVEHWSFVNMQDMMKMMPPPPPPQEVNKVDTVRAR